MRTQTSQPDQNNSGPVQALGVTDLTPPSHPINHQRPTPGTAAVEPLELELGVELHPLTHPLGDRAADAETLRDRIRAIRRELSHQLGFTVPPVKIRRTLGLPVDAFRINVHGEAIVTRKTHGEDIGPSSIVVESLTRTMIDHAHRLLTQDQIDMKIEMLRSTHESRIGRHIPDRLSHRTIHQVAAKVLQQHVSISHFETLVLALVEATDTVVREKTTDDLAQLSNVALNTLRCLSSNQSTDDSGYGEANVLPVVTLTPALESYLRTEPASQRVCQLIREQCSVHTQTNDHSIGRIATLITRSDLQSKIQDIVAMMDQSLQVITWQDVPLHRHVCVLGTIDASSP
ncbi:MAG: FHIPEP family type III secretion protein [Pseudomonadota bacterium]